MAYAAPTAAERAVYVKMGQEAQAGEARLRAVLAKLGAPKPLTP